MKKSELLKQKAKGKLSIGSTGAAPALAVVPKQDELRRITLEIRSDLDELNDIGEWWKAKKERIAEIKTTVTQRLIFVRDNSKRLLGGRTFEDYLTNDIGISKGHFYEQIQAYNVCVEHKRPELFTEVDPKVLVNIAREKDLTRQKELIKKAPTLTREYFAKEKRAESGLDGKDSGTSPKGVGPQADYIKLAREYHHELNHVISETEKLSEKYAKLAKTHRKEYDKYMKKKDREKDKEKANLENERAKIYEEVALAFGVVGLRVKSYLDKK